MRRTYRPGFPLDLVRTLAPLVRGPHDVTAALTGSELWRATRTPAGPATLHLRRAGDAIEAEAWGPGSASALDGLPALLGAQDDPGAFRPNGGILRDLHRRHPGVRLTRNSALVETLLPSILEQKVVGREAWRSYAALTRAIGEPAPGPAGLRLPPSPERLAEQPYHVFHPFGIERRRAATLVAACRRAGGLGAAAEEGPQAATRALLSIPGIGPWTAAEATRLTFGDPDAVSVGDYHLPHLVSWVLAREPRGTDERMLELLEPYRGQRARVIRLLEVSGLRAPRFGPGRRLRSIAAI